MLQSIDLPPRPLSHSSDAVPQAPSSPESKVAQLVLLHGWGANCRDLVPVAQALGKPDCHYWFPNAPLPHPQVPGGQSWFGLEGLEGADESAELLQNWLLTLEERSGIPLERTVLAGFSQGGAMTLRVGLGIQPRLAGLVCLSGFWVGEPLVADANSPFPPVLMVHGSRDPVVPIAYAHNTKRKLESMQVNLRFYEVDAMHEIPPQAIALFKEFLDKL